MNNKWIIFWISSIIDFAAEKERDLVSLRECSDECVGRRRFFPIFRITKATFYQTLYVIDNDLNLGDSVRYTTATVLDRITISGNWKLFRIICQIWN